MRQVLTWLLIVALSLPLALTAIVLVHFQLERERIINEVCVQRSMPASERTCNGKCHLKRQLPTQEASEQKAPTSPRLQLRVEPAITTVASSYAMMPVAYVWAFRPETRSDLAIGHRSIAEPVPWG